MIRMAGSRTAAGISVMISWIRNSSPRRSFTSGNDLVKGRANARRGRLPAAHIMRSEFMVILTLNSRPTLIVYVVQMYYIIVIAKMTEHSVTSHHFSVFSFKSSVLSLVPAGVRPPCVSRLIRM